MKPAAQISAIVFALSGLLAAQAPPQNPPPAPAKPGTSLSVTGCLQKTETEAYTLTSSDGKRYELRTSNTQIKFADHVGQQVTATGAGAPTVPTAPPATKVDPQGFLDVIALVVLNPTCQP